MNANHPNPQTPPKGQIITKPPPTPRRAPILRKPVSRLVIVENVYHQPVDGQPASINTGFTRRLTSDEQPYGPRRVKIGGDSMALETGWVEKASQIMIENLEGTKLQVYPTEEEKAKIAARVVEVWDEDGKEPLFLIPPGESIRARPGKLSRIRLRCASESARVVYTIYPD